MWRIQRSYTLRLPQPQLSKTATYVFVDTKPSAICRKHPKAPLWNHAWARHQMCWAGVVVADDSSQGYWIEKVRLSITNTVAGSGRIRATAAYSTIQRRIPGYEAHSTYAIPRRL